MVENKPLTGDVDRLWLEVERTSKDRAAREEQVSDLPRRLAKKNREKTCKNLDYQNVLFLVLSNQDNYCYCRSRRRVGMPPQGERSTRPGTHPYSGEREKNWRRVEDQGPRVLVLLSDSRKIRKRTEVPLYHFTQKY